MTPSPPDRASLQLPIANMLWVEGRLGPIERACMRSVMRQGHQLVLWHYHPLSGVPEGVELRDGDEIVSLERLFRHAPSGSYALFSNLFRYVLMQRGLGLWLDCDMYLLKPIEWGDGHIYGFESPGQLNTSIFALPADSEALPELISYFDGRSIPPWLPLRWRIFYACQRALTGRYRIETMPWGNLGPKALTALAGKHDLLGKARPQHEFCPWGWKQARWLFVPGEQLENHICPETRAVHLFNEMIREGKDRPAPRGSFLEILQQEGA